MAGEDSSTGGLAGRYATALLELADEQKALDAVAADLGGLKELIAESEDLRRLLTSPLYSREQQSAALGPILDKAGVNPLTRRFLMVVAQNRRLFALPRMIDAFLSELARRRGEVPAEVTTAHALTDEQRNALVDTLNRSVGGKVRMSEKVDPALLGGLVVRVGSRMIDGSLRGKLQRLQLAMKGTA